MGKIRLGQCKFLQVKKKEVKLGWVNMLKGILSNKCFPINLAALSPSQFVSFCTSGLFPALLLLCFKGLCTVDLTGVKLSIWTCNFLSLLSCANKQWTEHFWPHQPNYRIPLAPLTRSGCLFLAKNKIQVKGLAFSSNGDPVHIMDTQVQVGGIGPPV